MSNTNIIKLTLKDAPKDLYDYLDLCSIKTAAKTLDELFGLPKPLLEMDEAHQWAEYKDVTRRIKSSIKYDLKRFQVEDFRPLNESDFFKSVEVYRQFKEQLALDQLASRLKYSPEAEAKLKPTLEAMWGREWTENELNAFRHWLWLVKRNTLNKPVVQRIWLNIYGVTNAGKTTFINKLVQAYEPVKHQDDHKYVGAKDVDSLFDQTQWLSMSKQRIVVLNELAHLSRADNDALKMLIDTPTFEFRPLYSRTTKIVTNRVSFISSSNNSFEVLLTDHTSARRFYEIGIHQLMNRDAVNSTDFIEIWRAVDENREEGYYTQAIFEEQERRFKAEDPIEVWLKTLVKESKENFEYKRRPKLFKDLYQNYVEWCQANGFKPLNSFWLGRKIKQYGYLIESRTERDRMYKPVDGFIWG